MDIVPRNLIEFGLFLLIVFLVLVLMGILFWAMPITRWYIAAIMAKYDFIFTIVPESYFKEVVRSGAHKKTLLSKRGYKINENGDIVQCAQGEKVPETLLTGGLMVVGWPLIDTIYKREMKFTKSLPNGEIKAYNVKDVDKFYAAVDYPYILPFEQCKDKNNLPLLGHATLLAHVVNPVKSLFATANFYDTMIGLVLSSVRKCLKEYSFDEIKAEDDLNDIIWAELNSPNPDEPWGVINRLRDKYGVVIVALRIVNIDPPERYRNLTLTKWKAEREADAAHAFAKKEAEETEGRVVESVARANGMKREDLEIILKTKPELKGLPAEKGGYKEDFEHARDLLKRDRAGRGLKDIRVGNVDGTSLEPAISALAAMFGFAQNKESSGSGDSGKNPGGGKGGQQGGGAGAANSPSDNPADAAERYFKRHGEYPDWDPLQRTPK